VDILEKHRLWYEWKQAGSLSYFTPLRRRGDSFTA